MTSKITYPTITLRNLIVFPTGKVSLVVEGEEVAKAVVMAHKNKHLIVLEFQKNGDKSNVGVLSRIVQHWELAPNILGLLVDGLKRVKILREFTEEGMEKIEIEEIEDLKEDKTEIEALSRNVLEQFKKVIQMEGNIPVIITEELQKEYISPEKVSDIISWVLRFDFLEKVKLLETLDVKKRLEILKGKLTSELNIAQTERKIQEEMEKEVGKAQKEYVLRERLKAIEKELGITQEQKEYEDLEKKLLNAELSSDSKKKIMGEFNRLKKMPPGSPEISYLRTYLEWITEIPWIEKSESIVNIKKASSVLDEDHYGLNKAKERILEYLAVQKLTNGKSKGTILCFVGPPGTGKTSMGQSIARAIGRKFVRISLGGIRDEAEIRGHRRTYVGAIPGRIIQGIRTAGTKNPIFMMDEIDKIGADFRGDPASALLEVLDPAQNNNFSDHYIEIPFDLSEVFFITTANILDPIPPALRDRMEVIEFPGYTEDEKFKIAKKFLMPRVLSSTGLKLEQLDLSDEVIRKIITHYTKEAGVRDLERKISDIARKVALIKAQGKKEKIIITENNLHKYLGPEEYEFVLRSEQDEIGVSTGLAWTPAGGEIMFVEASLIPGKGRLILTGQLGDVMQESARAALTYVRSKAQELNFDPDFFYKSDIHVHVPEGAIKKDGPSAGIAIATALASVVIKKKIKKEVALTGEITLSGKVLKIGGIKEKVLAAHRAKVQTVIMPFGNDKNLIDIPEEVKKELKFKFVKHMDEVLKLAIL